MFAPNRSSLLRRHNHLMVIAVNAKTSPSGQLLRLPVVPRPLPRRIERVRMPIASPHHTAFPKWGGSASALSVSRPRSGFTHITVRRIAQPPTGDLCHEAPALAVVRTSRSSATGSIDNSPGGFFLH